MDGSCWYYFQAMVLKIGPAFSIVIVFFPNEILIICFISEAAVVGRGCSTKDKVFYKECETHNYGDSLEKMCFCSFQLCNTSNQLNCPSVWTLTLLVFLLATSSNAISTLRSLFYWIWDPWPPWPSMTQRCPSRLLLATTSKSSVNEVAISDNEKDNIPRSLRLILFRNGELRRIPHVVE